MFGYKIVQNSTERAQGGLRDILAGACLNLELTRSLLPSEHLEQYLLRRRHLHQQHRQDL